MSRYSWQRINAWKKRTRFKITTKKIHLAFEQKACFKVCLSIESHAHSCIEETDFKEATEIDPIIGRIADSSFMFEKRTGISIDSILYNRVEKLWRTSVNKSPTYRRISIDIVGLWFKMNKYRVFQSFFLQKFYLLSCCHRTYRASLYIWLLQNFEKTMFHFENYSGQSMIRGNNDNTFDDIIQYIQC